MWWSVSLTIFLSNVKGEACQVLLSYMLNKKYVHYKINSYVLFLVTRVCRPLNYFCKTFSLFLRVDFKSTFSILCQGNANFSLLRTILYDNNTWVHSNSIILIVNINIYLFGVLRRFQHGTGHITMDSFVGRGNQHIQLVKVLYCKLPTMGKQLTTLPHRVWVWTTHLRGGRWVCYHCATLAPY